MADSVLSWQAYGLTQVALAAVGQGTKPMRGDDLLNGGAACYQVYATADGGFISLGAIEEYFGVTSAKRSAVSTGLPGKRRRCHKRS